MEEKIKKNVILGPYTTYKIGGPADYFIEASTPDDLAEAVLYARQHKIPYFILGSGANVLITDKGFRGLVVYNLSKKFEFDNTLLRAQSGALIADIIDSSLDRELSGLEHFIGIPSTVGGAIWQNLHFLSPDRQRTIFIEEILKEAVVLDENGQVKTVNKDYFQFGYDDSILHYKEVIVLESVFQLESKPRAEIESVIKENMLWRTTKQPQLWAYPSCGSVFKKIKDAGAGRLIEQAGLKGKRLGGAQISEKHCNYIVNVGGATSEDVFALINLVQSEVKEKTGYFLETEIGIVGER